MLLTFFPCAREQHRILLVHEHALSIHSVLLEHADIPLQILQVLELPKPIIVSIFELTDILDLARSYLPKTVQLAVPEFSLQHPRINLDVQDSLPNSLTILPHTFVDVA